MRLDHERLAALEEEFKDKEDGLEMPDFIWLLQCAIAHPPQEKYELVNGLIKLFNDIDINGDENVEWSEFTQYIIDAVITSNNDGAADKKDPDEEDAELFLDDQASENGKCKKQKLWFFIDEFRGQCIAQNLESLC